MVIKLDVFIGNFFAQTFMKLIFKVYPLFAFLKVKFYENNVVYKLTLRLGYGCS